MLSFDERVVRDIPRPIFQLSFRRQFTVQQQVGNLEIGAFLSQLVDWIATVFENPFVAIDERDAALARGRIHKRGIVGHQTKVLIGNPDLSQVSSFDSAVFNRQFELLSGSVVDDRQGTCSHNLHLPFLNLQIPRVTTWSGQTAPRVRIRLCKACASKTPRFAPGESSQRLYYCENFRHVMRESPQNGCRGWSHSQTQTHAVFRE
jgi:hypothetical protein